MYSKYIIVIEHAELSKPVYDKIKEMILAQELKPGEKIIQEKVAESLGVSRTPLLKALQLLENEFLVESIPRRGMYVRKLGLKEMIDVYDCREAIEGMAARLLCRSSSPLDTQKLRNCFEPFLSKDEIDVGKYAQADEFFHRLLVKLTDNQPLERIYFFGNIHDRVVDLGLVRSPEETLAEHFKIIEAIEERNPQKAEKYTRDHIRRSKKILRNHFKKQQKEKINE